MKKIGGTTCFSRVSVSSPPLVSSNTSYLRVTLCQPMGNTKLIRALIHEDWEICTLLLRNKSLEKRSLTPHVM